MTITTLPTAPNTLRPSTFATEMDTFLAALIVFQTELNAAASAIGISLTATSATSLTVGTGSKSFTASISKGFVAGMNVVIASTASPTNRMVGIVTSYDIGTGAMVVDVTATEGSGTIASWTVSLTVATNLNYQTFLGSTFTDYTETLYAPAAGSAFTINLANGSLQKLTTNANCTITLPSSVSGKSYTLIVAYGGAHSITWAGGSTIKWSGGAAPTATSTSGKFDFFLFTCDGTNTYGRSSGGGF